MVQNSSVKPCCADEAQPARSTVASATIAMFRQHLTDLCFIIFPFALSLANAASEVEVPAEKPPFGCGVSRLRPGPAPDSIRGRTAPGPDSQCAQRTGAGWRAVVTVSDLRCSQPPLKPARSSPRRT